MNETSQQTFRRVPLMEHNNQNQGHIIHEPKRTTISLPQDICRELKQRGKFGQSWSDLIRKLLRETSKELGEF